MSRPVVTSLVLITVLMILGTACGSGPESEKVSLSVGRKAPDFSLPAPDGTSIRLADFRGDKPVLLYFSMGPG